MSVRDNLAGLSQCRQTSQSYLILSSAQATIALMKDGTIAVEVSTSLTLIQWPFLTDISLAWAAASIFDPNLAGNESPEGLAKNEIDAVLANAELGPWLYFNCILRDSQAFIPVADPVRLHASFALIFYLSFNLYLCFLVTYFTLSVLYWWLWMFFLMLVQFVKLYPSAGQFPLDDVCAL